MKTLNIDALAEAIRRGDRRKMFANMGNVFENVSVPACPEIAEYKKIMLDLGAEYALMSGSGSAVFGIFGSREAADLAMGEFRHKAKDCAGVWLV